MKYYLVFLLLAAVPAGLQILFELSSYTQGFAVNVLLILCIVLVSKRFSRYLGVLLKEISSRVYICVALLALLHFGIVIFRWYIGMPVDFFKFLVGLLMFGGLWLQAAFVSYIVIRIVHKNDKVAVRLFVMTYLLLGLVGTLGYTVFGPITVGKPVFFYSEISHYALGIAPLYCAWTVLTTRWYVRWFGHLTICVIGYLYQSTTLFIVLLSVIFVSSRTKLTLAIVAITIGVLVLGGGETKYYTSRLSYSFNENASENWVYLQGWQEAFLNFYDSYGVGVGLQQFGIAEPRGEIAQAVAALFGGTYGNRFEGSFGAPKIIGEFGVLGVVFIIFLTIEFVRSANKLRSFNVSSSRGNDQIADIFAHSFVYVFFIYLFIRGGGYFGPNYVYLVSGLILIYFPRAVSSLKGFKRGTVAGSVGLIGLRPSSAHLERGFSPGATHR